jgi:cellulose synthase/poly-beta-1,6-N-acetylglucosamine synthase-like glycosyltransferase
LYLDLRILKKCGLDKAIIKAPEKVVAKDKNLIVKLRLMLFIVLIIFPVVYLFRHYNILGTTITKQLSIYALDMNYYLAAYFTIVNLFYFVLLSLSYNSAKKQNKMWALKNKSMLFKKKMLPSISIIAPAFNEEKSIIDSTNSLLNLKYPDYEVIIVNDGSNDGTLEKLKEFYKLKRVDYTFEYKLETKKVNGIYLNSSLPNLIVVDKVNGGKADSLNTGINISSKDYFCGIDADSLLEDEALLKLTSLSLDEKIETTAMGGNVFPINGCTVNRGQLTSIEIPKNKLARLQTLEYIRAFMAGRLGWASFNSLLIVSGAFGIFKKQRAIDVGGYLTSSGKYGKDTVGEDMELVVRIRRNMFEKKIKHKVSYSYNANCWTEIPEKFNSLKKQRYRWHRGLIDIITFHKKMLFNPQYGAVGTIALPYFFIFEMMGPFIELQGYIMVIVLLFLGLLNWGIVLMLFIATILMGVFISIMSLIIAEKNLKYLRYKELSILIFYAIIENFGPRQIMSLLRVFAYINVIKEPSQWNKFERKGFDSDNKV